MVGNLVWKADFSKKNLKKILSNKKCHFDIYTVELRQHDHPLEGAQLVVLALAGPGWSCHTCIPKGFMYYRDHYIYKIISLIQSYLALSYVLP